MGQQSTSHVQDYVSNSFAKIVFDDPQYSLIADDIISMSYDDFISRLGELNTLSNKCLDSSGKQLIFAVKKGSDSTLFWKATVQIACVKIVPKTNIVSTYRLLNLKEFLQVFKTLKCQYVVVEESKSKDNEDKMTASAFYENLDDVTKSGASSLDTQTECCICLERKPNVLLPCTHSYCLQCIEEWNVDHDTCPICREQLESTDDTWVLSDIPKAEEISEELRSTLMDLAEDKSHKCNQS